MVFQFEVEFWVPGVEVHEVEFEAPEEFQEFSQLILVRVEFREVSEPVPVVFEQVLVVFQQVLVVFEQVLAGFEQFRAGVPQLAPFGLSW